MCSQRYGNSPSSGGSASYDSALQFLKQLNTKQLQELMDDSARLNKMVDDLDLVKKHAVDKQSKMASNKSMAEYNLSCEPRLIQARQQLAETYDKAIKVQKEFDKTKLKFDTSSPNTSLDTTLALLQTEAAKSEEESELCAEAFLSRKIDSDSFVKKYLDMRTQGHKRKVKVDKLSEIVREQERKKYSNLVASSHPTPKLPSYNPPANNWAGSSTPYPLNPPANFPMAAYH